METQVRTKKISPFTDPIKFYTIFEIMPAIRTLSKSFTNPWNVFSHDIRYKPILDKLQEATGLEYTKISFIKSPLGKKVYHCCKYFDGKEGNFEKDKTSQKKKIKEEQKAKYKEIEKMATRLAKQKEEEMRKQQEEDELERKNNEAREQNKIYKEKAAKVSKFHIDQNSNQLMYYVENTVDRIYDEMEGAIKTSDDQNIIKTISQNLNNQMIKYIILTKKELAGEQLTEQENNNKRILENSFKHSQNWSKTIATLIEAPSMIGKAVNEYINACGRTQLLTTKGNLMPEQEENQAENVARQMEYLANLNNQQVAYDENKWKNCN